MILRCICKRKINSTCLLC